MAKHRQLSVRAQTARQFGLRWQLEGERLTRSFKDVSPRLVCIARRFENRGLVVDSTTAQISIPRVAERQKRGKGYLLGLGLLPVILVAIFLVDEPEKVPKKVASCAIEVGKRLPSKANVSRKVALGGLSVLNLSCNGSSYSVTIDAKGAIVGSKTL